MPFRESFFDNFLIRATGRLSLNDPFDVSPSVEYFSDLCLTTKHYRFGKDKQEIEEFLNRQPDKNTWKQLGMSEYFDNGVISLTETEDNLLMWAHYANEHKGIIIELDSEHKFFNVRFSEKNRQYYGQISRVLYRKQRLNKFNSFVEPYFHKSNEWIYEKEHRFLVSLHKADRRLIRRDDLEMLIKSGMLTGIKISNFSDDLVDIVSCDFHGSLVMHPKVMFMFKLPPEAIKSVIKGAKMPIENNEKLINAIARNPALKKVQKLKAELDPYRYQVNIKKNF